MQDKIIKLIKDKQFNELKLYINEENEADISEALDELNSEDAALVFRLLNKDIAADVFSRMESDTQEKLIEILTDSEISSIISNLYVDDAVDLISELPANLVKRILSNTKSNKRKVINELLQYPSDSAGSIMTTEFIDLHEDQTVREAFERIRKIGMKKETIYTCYVIDNKRNLVGVTTVKELLMNDFDTLIKDMMETSVITINTHEDQEVVAHKFDKYDFLAMPVVDSENRLVGIITIDDAFDVLSEENEEDFEIMAAMTPSEDSYFKTSIFDHTKNRIFWLLFLMLSAAITGSILTHYQEAFAAAPILVSFIPMLMGTGGNCGSQSSTLIIRGLATNEIKLKDVLKVWFKEVRIAILVGLVLSLCNGIRIFIQYGDFLLALVITLSIFFIVILAKSIGCLLPIAAKKLGLDPAIMASPLITTILDTCSMLIYFGIAVMILGI